MRSHYLIRGGVTALVLGLALAGPALAEITYNYVELDYVNVDVDESSRVLDSDVDLRVTSDDDAGFRLGGAWQFYRNWHVFGEFSKAENDVVIDGTVLGSAFNTTGDFDVTRWRIGAGYGHPVNPDLNVYGRLSYDSIEFDSFDLSDTSGLDGDLNTDDNGIGAEVGLRWQVADPLELHGYVRYTAVGDVDVNSDDEFDDDTLFGAGARYYFGDHFGVQAGYEAGEISTWNLGARVRF